MGKNTRVPPAPNYAPIAQASEASAQLSAQVAREQLAWAREQYASDQKITSQVVNAALARQNELDVIARKDRQRYEQLFQPLEEDLIEEAEGYTDARNTARAEQAAGRASADVSQQYEMARAAAQDRLESYGIDPSQTRAGALDIGARIQEAAARAGAANTTRDTTLAREEAIGRALRSEALNIGRGMPGQVVGTYGAALQQGAGGQGAALAQTASGANTMGTGMGWQGLSNQALGTWGNTLNMGHQNQMAAYNARQQQSSGWGQALGMVAGLGANIMMPGMQTAFSGFMNPRGMHNGGLVTFEEGGVVPETASPSRGINIDDVNVDIRGPTGQKVANGALNVGEFVVPDDVVKWKGEEFFQKLIGKSREARQEAPARPDVVSPRPGNPARQALPLR